MRTTITEQKSSIQEKTKIVNELKIKIPTVENTLEKAKNELKQVKCKLAQLAPDLHKKKTSLEEMRSSMQASNSKSRIVDALMNEKKNGRCPGVIGRLVSKKQIYLIFVFVKRTLLFHTQRT